MQKTARFVSSLALVAAIVAAIASNPVPAVGAGTTLRQAAQLALADAKVNFGHLHAGVDSTDDYSTGYVLTPAFRAMCWKFGPCGVYDEFGSKRHPERWVVDMNIVDEKGDAKTHAADTLATLGPILKGWKFSRSESNGRIYLEWDGPNSTWVSVGTNGASAPMEGYSLRIGHDLAHNTHMVKLRPVPAAEKASLGQAIPSFIRSVAADATSNFATLRTGSADAEHKYTCAVSATLISGCFVEDASANTHPKWFLSADSVSIGGSTINADALVHDLVASSLPAGWHEDTDPAHRDNEDYLWIGPDHVNLYVTDHVTDGKLSVTFDIYHFIQ